MTVEQNILSHILIGIEYIRKIICNNSILHDIIKYLVWYNHDTNPFSIKHIFGGFLDFPDVCADIFFFWHQKIIITFLANEIHCSVEMALTLGKHRSPSSWIHLHLPNLTDTVCLLQALSRGVCLRQSGKEPGLWLHQFRLIWLGLPLAVQTDDARRLGAPLPAGGQHIYRNFVGKQSNLSTTWAAALPAWSSANTMLQG